MNTRDVVMTAGVLLAGILVGYLLGRNSVLTTPHTDPASAESPPAAKAQNVPAHIPTAVVPKLPAVSPEKPPVVGPEETTPPPRQPAPTPDKIISPLSLSDIPLMGDPATAKVAITVFSDFQ